MWKMLWSGGAKHVCAFLSSLGYQQHHAGSIPFLSASDPACYWRGTHKKGNLHPSLTPFVYSQRSTAAGICGNFFVRLVRKRTTLKSRWSPSSTFFMIRKFPLLTLTFFLKANRQFSSLPSTSLSFWSVVLYHFLQNTPIRWSICFY